MPEIVIIAAVAKNRVIGRDNQLIWNIPEDMAHFKALTAGHTVIMGRKTWESLPPRFRPLPGRRNIVITRQPDYAAPGAELADSLENALKLASTATVAYIIGGEQIYTQAMAVADRLEITEVDQEPEGDAWFPEIVAVDWEKAAKAANKGFAFVTYLRRREIAAQHFEHSSYREKLIEHLFVGDLLKHSWLNDGCSLEVAKPEVDNAGYDLIAEANGVVRHIQLKTSVSSGSTASQKIHVRLADKPSGCVIWICFDENTLELGPFRYFGASAGEPLPSLSEYKVGKHTKGNKDGIKTARQNIRVIPKGKFQQIVSIKEIYELLFESS